MRNHVAFSVLLLAAAGAASAQSLEAPATGTGTISGRVVDAGTGAPIAEVRLSLSQTRGHPIGVYARSERFTTDMSGTFRFHSLPAGQFSISATADGYLPGAMGKRRPKGQEAWIALRDGQAFSNATIELFRAGTISGVVTNDRGEPMKGVRIETWMRDSKGAVKVGREAATDAAGAYRITELQAGDHFVVARVWHRTIRQGPPLDDSCNVTLAPPLQDTLGAPVIGKPMHSEPEWFPSLPPSIPEPAPDDDGRPRTLATTMFPGVSEVSVASAVNVVAGADHAGIDFHLRPVPTTYVQGRLVPLPGRAIGKGSEVRLRLPGYPSNLSEHTTLVQPDNTFRILGVPPASYMLEVQLQETSCDTIVRNSDDVLTTEALDVPASGLGDLFVPIAAGISMHGRIHFDGKAPRPGPGLMDIGLTPMSVGDARFGAWDDDAQIIARGLSPGLYALRVSQNGDAKWFIRSMTLGGLDLVKHPVAIGRDDSSGLDVAMTDRPSPLNGRIDDATGNLVRDATVIVFPVDAASWRNAHDDLPGFSHARSLDGTYHFDHLVPGDYFVAAVDERRMDDWPRADFLATVSKRAAPVRIVHGQSRTLNLTLQAP